MEIATDNHDDFVKIAGKDERAMKEIRKIRDLDMSIREMERELKTARAETTDLQSKNRDELKKKLLHIEPWETAAFIKNCRRFIDLFGEPSEDEIFNHDDNRPEDKNIKFPKVENEDLVISLSIENDEANDRPNFLANVDSTDEPSLNPFQICESSRKMLQEIDDKLKENSHNG